jgi:hypothetical protein
VLDHLGMGRRNDAAAFPAALRPAKQAGSLTSVAILVPQLSRGGRFVVGGCRRRTAIPLAPGPAAHSPAQKHPSGSNSPSKRDGGSVCSDPR